MLIYCKEYNLNINNLQINIKYIDNHVVDKNNASDDTELCKELSLSNAPWNVNKISVLWQNVKLRHID